MTTPPTDQRRAWNGPEGAHWRDMAEHRRESGDLVDDVARAASFRLGERVLDLGCGAGDVTLRAASVVGEGSVFGVDLSELLIATARERAAAAAIRNATFRVGDVASFAFEHGAFDVAVSHFGVMFFDDPTRAFTNVATALRPGGRLVFVCPADPDDCDWYGVPLTALHGHRPSAEDAPSAMFSLADPSLVQRILNDSGFERIDVSPLARALWFGEDAEAAAMWFLGTGPVRSFLERNPSVTADQARTALAATLAPFVGPDGVRLDGAHWLVRAQRSVGAGR